MPLSAERLYISPVEPLRINVEPAQWIRQTERGSIFDNFSGHADGEHRGAGSNPEGSVGKVLVRRVSSLPSDRPRPSVFAVGMLRYV